MDHPLDGAGDRRSTRLPNPERYRHSPTQKEIIVAQSPLLPFTAAEVIAVAERQRAILWLILISFAAFLVCTYLTAVTSNPSFSALLWIPGIVSIFFVYKLAKALRASAILYAICSILPGISLFTLLMLNSRATGVLTSRGIRLGLMGARSSDLSAFASAAS
jgi:hypothetical protein